MKGCIGKPIRALLPRLEALGYHDFMEGSQQVMLSQLKEAVLSFGRAPVDARVRGGMVR